jgi:hypothetical protein
MPRRHLSPKELQELRDLAVHWGEIIARRTGGDLDLDLDAMEQIAQAASQGLIEGTLQTLLRRRADACTEPQPCPACGRLCPVTHEDRTIHLQDGQPVTHREPLCHCPACRRDFFPPPARPAS